MQLLNQMVCSVAYQLHITENEERKLIDQSTVEAPLTFLVGSGQLLAKFEENLMGKSTGDKVNFLLAPEDAYGNYRMEDIVSIPKANLAHPDTGHFDEEIIKLGSVIPLQDQDGNPFQGIVKQINQDDVSIDFNHPLAGKSLDFEVEILEVRQATEEEIAHGHAHGPGGHRH
ncbi:MAG: FKBP-type peptidyl-prolyl cis-trans isomerase [Chitinophagales bacterium]|jgi:FKBP-type peptidyl-prolyl cis-trans isomerase SlyD|nr:FKBP-type peptidyl-prolyl cis-trans isomerase [Chitinophagales bacterium]